MTLARQTGDAGETAACLLLEQKGYRILARNYRCKTGEIDIVAQRKNVLAFVEVKTRASSVAFGGPIAAVTAAKQRKIASAATSFIKEKGVKFDSIRFDVVTVLPQGLEHLENAFSPQRNSL